MLLLLGFLRWLIPLGNLSQQRIVYLMFCTVYLRIEPRAEPGSTECDFKVISRQKGRVRKLRKEKPLNLNPDGCMKKGANGPVLENLQGYIQNEPRGFFLVPEHRQASC